MARTIIACVVVALTAAAAMAQEVEPPSPWVALKDANAGAVGTCPPIDGGDDAGVCYLVRCEAGKDLVFAIQDPILEDFKVLSVRFKAGKFNKIYRLDKRSATEGVIPLASHPELLAALEGQAKDGMVLRSAEAANAYVTSFELTGAKKAIATVKAHCGR